METRFDLNLCNQVVGVNPATGKSLKREYRATILDAEYLTWKMGVKSYQSFIPCREEYYGVIPSNTVWGNDRVFSILEEVKAKLRRFHRDCGSSSKLMPSISCGMIEALDDLGRECRSRLWKEEDEQVFSQMFTLPDIVSLKSTKGTVVLDGSVGSLRAWVLENITRAHLREPLADLPYLLEPVVYKHIRHWLSVGYGPIFVREKMSRVIPVDPSLLVEAHVREDTLLLSAPCSRIRVRNELIVLRAHTLPEFDINLEVEDPGRWVTARRRVGRLALGGLMPTGVTVLPEEQSTIMEKWLNGFPIVGRPIVDIELQRRYDREFVQDKPTQIAEDHSFFGRKRAKKERDRVWRRKHRRDLRASHGRLTQACMSMSIKRPHLSQDQREQSIADCARNVLVERLEFVRKIRERKRACKITVAGSLAECSSETEETESSGKEESSVVNEKPLPSEMVTTKPLVGDMNQDVAKLRVGETWNVPSMSYNYQPGANYVPYSQDFSAGRSYVNECNLTPNLSQNCAGSVNWWNTPEMGALLSMSSWYGGQMEAWQAPIARFEESAAAWGVQREERPSRDSSNEVSSTFVGGVKNGDASRGSIQK